MPGAGVIEKVWSKSGHIFVSPFYCFRNTGIRAEITFSNLAKTKALHLIIYT